MAKLIVVIPTHDRVDLLRRTLGSLAECRLPANFGETIVVENGGRRGAEAAARDASPALRVKYLYHEQGNKSAALNAVLAVTRNALLVFLDDDVRLDPRVLEAYERAAREHPGMFYGGPMGIDYESPPNAVVVPHLPVSARGWEHLGVDDVIGIPVMLGCNWAASAEHLIAAGGFDSSRGPGAVSGATGQESQMQRALIQRGILGKYVPEAKVWHFVPKDRCSKAWLFERRFRTGVEHGLNAARKFDGHFGVPKWVVRKAASAYFRLVAAQLIGKSDSKLNAELQWQVMKGCIHGFRTARQLKRADAQIRPCHGEPKSRQE